MDEIVKIKGELRLEEWREMIRARTESGLGTAKWCKVNGVNLKTYYYRLKKIREKACERLEGRREEDAQQIVPISLPLCSAPKNDIITISNSNIKIELPEGVSESLLGMIIEALKC